MKSRKRRRGRWSHDDSGAAAVEFGLLLPLLLLIVMGIIDFGRAFNAQITLNQAAREGVRVWALTANAGQASTRTQAAAAPTLAGVTIATTACTNGNPTTLTASYTFTYVTPVGWLMDFFGAAPANSIAMTSQATARCNG